MSQQLSPHADYSLNEHVTWTIQSCIDCEDLFMGTGEPRCITCQDAHRDELETCMRVIRERIGRAVTEALCGRSGGMNDPRSILCEECGEEAATFVGYPVDGARGVCPHCGTAGKIDVDQDDEGHATVRFVAVKP